MKGTVMAYQYMKVPFMANAMHHRPCSDEGMTMGKLDGKVALITGAARGQGRSHAVGLAAEGADIIALDICAQLETVPYPMGTPDELAETARLVEEQDRRILPVQADVRDLAAVRDAVARGLAEFGRLDIVLPNAGILATIGAEGDSEQAFYDSVDVMLTGVWHTIRATIPVLVDQGQGGSIVITSSTAGIRGVYTPMDAGSAGYAAAKHAVVGLMRVYANLYGKHSIRINTVHPTGVNSPMIVNEAFNEFVGEYPDVADMLQNLLPVPMVEPEDITRAIVWLVSDDARYVTGAMIPVDAGFTARV